MGGCKRALTDTRGFHATHLPGALFCCPPGASTPARKEDPPPRQFTHTHRDQLNAFERAHLASAHRLIGDHIRSYQPGSPRPVGSLRHLAFPRAEFLIPRSSALGVSGATARRREPMVVRDLTPGAVACRSCGAYGNSQHRPTCQPGRRFHRTIRVRKSSFQRTDACNLSH